MTDVRQQAPARVLAGFEPGGHRVERADERAHPAGTALANADGKVPGLDLSCRADEVAERRGEQAQASHGRHHEEHADEHDREDRPAAGELERTKQDRDRDRDDGAEGEHDHRDEQREAPHEAAANRPPLAARRRERLVLGPPWRPAARAVPGAPHSSGSANR